MKTRRKNQRARLALAVLTMTFTCISCVGADDGDSRDVVAGASYRAGWLHRLLLGPHYRELWTATVDVEVLDLATFAGGLRVVGTGGGKQTKSLHLLGADGRAYSFRSVDKDPSEVLPPELRGTIAEKLVQDQISAANPAAALVVAPLLDAADLLHVEPRLVIIPDDPRLGEHRAKFAGTLGMLEEYPLPVSATNPGFAGAEEVLGHKELYARLEHDPRDLVDTRMLLCARLVDILVGDWDRHRGQWRWAKLPDEPSWQPVPEDRDQAFSRFDGIVMTMVRGVEPRLVSFGDDYPNLVGLTWNGRDQDRRLLAGLERATWTEIAEELQASLTNDVIDAAVARLPSSYRRLDGSRLTRALRLRRDRLKDVADRFYLQLAAEVDVHATDAAELVEVVRADDGTLDVSISADGSQPYFRRRFAPRETNEVRVYLHGGDDRVVTHGRGNEIRLRVVGGSGEAAVDDSAGGHTRVYGARDRTQILAGPGTSLDSRRWEPAPPDPDTPWVPHRDWGRWTLPKLLFASSPELGLFVHGGFVSHGYGFRKLPYADRHELDAGWAAGVSGSRVAYRGQFHRTGSRDFVTLDVLASQIEVVRFFGFGNQTEPAGSDRFHRVEQSQYRLAPSLHVPLGRRLSLAFGPRFQYSRTEPEADRFLSETSPYGVGSFGQIGAGVGFTADTRDGAAAPSRGVRLDLGVNLWPTVLAGEGSFRELHGEVVTYLSPGAPLRPTLALRVGGKRVWGHSPFHESAFLGGSENVRGFQSQRFAGDASLYGSAELRVALGEFLMLLPGRLGVFALGDVGRVYLEGEDSSRWHSAVGGGVWFSLARPTNTISVGVARSRERTALYVRTGFAF